LIHDFREDLSNEKTKDGLAKDLFPLTSDEQKDYEFKLLGQEIEQGRNVYHIAFRPKDKDEITWAGEAYIDAAEFQPVRVFTKLSRRIPFGVRTFLGTDLPRIGFKSCTRGKRMESGSRKRSGRNFGSTCCSSSTGKSLFRWRTQGFNVRTSKAK
jgi:hypothetical protein